VCAARIICKKSGRAVFTQRAREWAILLCFVDSAAANILFLLTWLFIQ
jgi:hypothetical protein